MKLSRVERLILSNQYKILAALEPKEKKFYEGARAAIEDGYELEYGELAQHIEEDTMSVEACREVIQIMSMHLVLKQAYKKLEDKSGIEKHRIEFRGFDGNNETQQMGYARHVCRDGRRFEGLAKGDGKDFNSHCPSIDRYRAMLVEWERSGSKNELSKDDVVRISNAGVSL